MMSDAQTPSPEATPTPVVTKKRPEHFFQNHLELFRQSLEAEGDNAYDRWGFSMLFGLNEEDAHQQLKSLGFESTDALGCYNEGCVAAQAEDFAKARELFAKACAADPELTDARFNLAIACERTGDNQAARTEWLAYLENCEDEDVRNEIEAHLKTL